MCLLLGSGESSCREELREGFKLFDRNLAIPWHWIKISNIFACNFKVPNTIQEYSEFVYDLKKMRLPLWIIFKDFLT
jgi:hypothetical protein